MAGQSPMLTETTMPPQIGIIPKKTNYVLPTRPNNAHKGQQGGTAAHANLTHPATPYRNALGVKILCNLPMLTREP